jgi:hypothetical protein
LFLGELEDYNLFFSDYKNYFRYTPKAGKDVFIGKKSTLHKQECYEREDNGFVVVDCNKDEIVETPLNDTDLMELLDSISTDLSNLKNLNGSEIGISTSESVLKTEKHKVKEIAIAKQNKPQKQQFKNFLLDYIVKETK